MKAMRAGAEAEAETQAQAQAEAQAQAKAEAQAQAQAEAQAQAKAEAQAQAQAPPPPKWHCIANFQADAGSSSSGHPQLHAPLFDLDPPADLGLLQSPEDACTVPSHRFVDEVLLDLHAQTH